MHSVNRKMTKQTRPLEKDAGYTKALTSSKRKKLTQLSQPVHNKHERPLYACLPPFLFTWASGSMQAADVLHNLFVHCVHLLSLPEIPTQNISNKISLCLQECFPQHRDSSHIDTRAHTHTHTHAHACMHTHACIQTCTHRLAVLSIG